MTRVPTSKIPAWWRPTWICLAGEQPLPNVLPVLAHPPTKVLFLHTSLKASREATHRCAALLRARDIQVETVETDAFDAARITKDVQAIAAAHPTADLLLNYTGGTKIMSLAAYQALAPEIPRLYFDSAMGVMVGLGPFGPAAQPLLTVDEMLALHAEVSPVSEVAGPIPAPQTIALIVRLIRKDPKLLWDLLTYRQKVLSRYRLKKGWVKITEPIEVPLAKHPKNAEALAKSREEEGLLESGEGFRPTAAGLEFMEGFWWEQFVFHQLSHGFTLLGVHPEELDIRVNLSISWNSAGTQTQNEFDIAFNYRNRLYFISCTSASEAESEKRRVQIEAFADRLGGRFAKAMLACTLQPRVLTKLQARGSDRVLIPEWHAWLYPKGLLKDWIGM